MSDIWVFLLVLVYAITCLFLILTVLLQSGKGGGLSSLGSGAGGGLSDSLGATGAEKTLVKATSWAAGIFLVLSLVLTLYGARLERSGGLEITPVSAPTAPAAPGSDAGQPAQPSSPQAPAAAPAASAS